MRNVWEKQFGQSKKIIMTYVEVILPTISDAATFLHTNFNLEDRTPFPFVIV